MSDTIIESVLPLTPSAPVRLDAWRFRGIPSFAEYVARVLAQEAARAARRAA